MQAAYNTAAPTAATATARAAPPPPLTGAAAAAEHPSPSSPDLQSSVPTASSTSMASPGSPSSAFQHVDQADHLLNDDSDLPALPAPLKPQPASTTPSESGSMGIFSASTPEAIRRSNPSSARESPSTSPLRPTLSQPPPRPGPRQQTDGHSSPTEFHPHCIRTLDSHARRPVTSIAVADGKLYAGGRDGAIAEWDLTSGTTARMFAPSHTKGITCICISGNRLFSASEDGAVTIWNITTGIPTRVIRGHEGYVTAVCVTPEGRLYSGGADRIINEWDVQTGRRQWLLTGHSRWVLSLCVGNGRLYSGSNDHTVRVWDMATKRCLMVLEEHRDWVFSLCLGRDLLYSSSRDGTVKVWDTSSGQCLRTLKGHDGASVRSVCIAGGKLYSAGDDKAIVEWDVKLGRPVRTLGGHFGAISTLCAGQDGKLYSGSGDCTVKIWQIYPTVSHLTDEIEYLREQLAKAQELLAKQNRLKFRLKSELTTARTDLVAARSELSTARGVATKVRELEEELSAAKELLVTYKVELSSTQDAHLWALDYILRQSDTSFMDIELEVASMRHLLESPWTPLVKESEGRDSLVAFMPPKATRRVWDADSDWDSDVELDTELAWWRNESHTGSRRRRPESTFSLGTETSDEIELGGAAASIERDTVASRPRPQSIVNRRLQATVEARRRARNDAEHHDGSSPYIVRNSSMLASGGDDAEDAATDDGDDGDTGYDLAEDLFTSDDETTPHARQNVRLPAPAGGGNGRRNAATPTAGSDRTGPYVAEGELISGQPRRASVADPSAAWPSPDRHTPAAAAASVDDLLDWPPPPPPAAPVAADLLGLAEPTSAWVDQATPRRRAEPAVVAPDLLTGEDVASGLLAPSLLPTATVAGGGGAVVPAPQLDRGSPVYTPPSSAANRRPSAVVPRPRSHSLRLASPPTITPIANSASPVPTAPPALPPSSSAASSWLRPLRSFVESIGEQLVPSAPAMEDPFKVRNAAGFSGTRLA